MVQVMIWIVEEWAWNVFPSTRGSSLAVVGVYAAVLGGVWWNWDLDEDVQVLSGDQRPDSKARIRQASSRVVE